MVEGRYMGEHVVVSGFEQFIDPSQCILAPAARSEAIAL